MLGAPRDMGCDMAKEHSSVDQARADDADEEMKTANLNAEKERFERSRNAWQGLAYGARERESEVAENGSGERLRREKPQEGIRPEDLTTENDK